MFQMLGVFAEFERGIIRERINAGLARAREKGVVLGRRPTAPAVEKRIRRLRAKGDGILKIGRTLGIGTSVVQRVVGEDARQACRALGGDRATAGSRRTSSAPYLSRLAFDSRRRCGVE